MTLSEPEARGTAAAVRVALSPTKRALLDTRRGRGSSSARPLPGSAAGAPPVLSFAQDRLWLIDQLDPGQSTYNSPRAFRIRGALDVDALRRALQMIVARHEVLRTTISAGGGGPVAQLEADPPMPFAFDDLSHLGPDLKEAELQRLVEAEIARPFDLSRDVLLRAHLYREAQEQHVLVIVSHHIASDDVKTGHRPGNGDHL